jgi:DNA-binding XRE family transcriptional regulator
MPTNKSGTATKTEPDIPFLLARFRSDKKYSTEDMARKLGIGVATVSRFERGVGGTNRTTRIRIETFLIRVGYLRARKSMASAVRKTNGARGPAAPVRG